MSKSHNALDIVERHPELWNRRDLAPIPKGDSRATDDAIYREMDVVTKWPELLKDVLTDF